MSPGFIQACNATSLSQHDTTPSTYHTPFHFSTNIPVQPQYPEANINGDAAVTWDMNVIKASQIDERSLHTVEDDKSRDKGDDDQYVVCNRSGWSLIRLGQYLSSPILRHQTSNPRRSTNRPLSSTRRAQPALPRA